MSYQLRIQNLRSMALKAMMCTPLILSASVAQAHNGAIVVANPISGITIDGNLDDWPSDIPTQSISRAEYGENPTDDADLAAKFRVGYSKAEQALMVAVEVTDDSEVIDPSIGKGQWNAQDGCEIYVDRIHAKLSLVEQYSRYGDRLELYGGGNKSKVQLKVGRTATGRVYEWRISLGADAKIGQSIGFDVSVLDKDKDGSFSWLAWGSGIGKRYSPNRNGDLLLLPQDTPVGQVAGAARMSENGQSEQQQLPPITIQSLTSPGLSVRVICEESGEYRATLPVGSYIASPADTNRLRVVETDHVHFQISENKETDSGLLKVRGLQRPNLIGKEGVLKATSLDTADVDRFVEAYMRYYRIPGVSLALLKDSQTVHFETYGVKNAIERDVVDSATAFEACSLTKPVFAFAVNRLVEKGTLDLKTPLYEYLPVARGYEDVLNDDRHKLITAQHVLTHRTGFPNWRASKLTIDFRPGTAFGYSGEGFEYLGAVVSHVAGKGLCDVIRDEVFEPLGIENSYLVWNDALAERTATGHVAGTNPISKSKTSVPGMAYSLHTDAVNYAKLLTAILQRKALCKASYDEMLRQQFDLSDTPASGERPYGLGMVAQETDLGMKYSHEGVNPGWRCKFVIYDKLKMGFVVFTNNEEGLEFAEDLEQYLVTGKRQTTSG